MNKLDPFDYLKHSIINNNWQNILRSIIKHNLFGSTFYDILFELDSSIKQKFNTMHLQSKFIVLLITLLSENLTKKEIKEKYKKIKKFRITRDIYNKIILALNISCLVILKLKNELHLFYELKTNIMIKLTKLQPHITVSRLRRNRTFHK